MEIPVKEISEDTLLGIIDDFVLREGTDYGHSDVALEKKRSDILRQLERGEAKILFDSETETCTIELSKRISDE